jgi:Protein of unknown function (DUF3300)
MRMPAIFLATILAMLAPSASFAQGQQPASGSNAQQPAPAGDNQQTGDAEQPKLLDAAQLDQLVAPIALYPDTLLAQVLMASTYPLEIVQAARWLEANKNLKGDALQAAAAKQDWDDSVKALVTTPTVIVMMNEQLDWTQSLGDAVLAQQADVMDAIQRLRAKAEDNGKLATTEQQKVTTTQQAGKQVIVIEPASPDVVYVPYYEPAVVYGAWAYPSYPPYYFPPAPGWVAGGALVSGIAWGAGFAIGNAIWNDYEPFNWGRNDIRVNVNKNVNINNINVNRNDLQLNSWKHNTNRNQFNRNELSSNQRNFDFRGHDGKQVLNVPNSRPGGKGPDFGGKGPGGKGPGGNGPDLGGKGPGGKGPGGKGPDLGGKGPGGKGPGGKGPDLGGKGPGGKGPGGGGGSKEAALKDRTPPAAKPSAGKKGSGGGGGGAFDMRDGNKAKSYSKRGQSSMGNRSPKSFSRPKGGGGGAAMRGGGRPGGGGGGRGRGGGGGRRR